MPSHIISVKLTTTKPKLHHRISKKHLKRQIQFSAKNSSECDCDENTMSEIVIQKSQAEGLQALKEIACLIRKAVNTFRYSVDTHFICLALLAKIKFQISINRVKLLTATLLLLAGKVHEFRTPKFTDILDWLQHQFNRVDLIKAEAELLAHFNFSIPVTLDLKGIKQLQSQVQNLEKSFC